jgi:hypothetical protein
MLMTGELAAAVLTVQQAGISQFDATFEAS